MKFQIFLLGWNLFYQPCSLDRCLAYSDIISYFWQDLGVIGNIWVLLARFGCYWQELGIISKNWILLARILLQQLHVFTTRLCKFKCACYCISKVDVLFNILEQSEDESDEEEEEEEEEEEGNGDKKTDSKSETNDSESKQSKINGDTLKNSAKVKGEA